jgi:hypothetical protein
VRKQRRNAGSGLFLAEQFLQKDQLILYTEGANMPRQDIKATGNGFLPKSLL